MTSSPSAKPNVLIVMTDQQAPQFSSVYGHKVAKTPQLERLAREGVVFENAYTPNPICVPARMSFMTGTEVQRNGTWDNGVPFPEDAVTWAHALKRQGYDVALSGKAHFRGHDHLHGFDSQLAYDINARNRPRPPDWQDPYPDDSKRRDSWPCGPGHSEEIDADNAVEEAALEYLGDARRQEVPWALLVGFVCPHHPFFAPQEYFDLFDLDDIDLPEIPEGHLKEMHPFNRRNRAARGMGGEARISDECMRRLRASYYALVRFIDDKLGRMLDKLEATGQRENTMVVFTSDHGEMMGEHGMMLKSAMYEHSARIPLVASFPGKEGAGLRVDRNVNLIDLTATILEQCGSSEELPSDVEIDGRDLRPLLEAEGRQAWDNATLSEYYANFSWAPTAMYKRDHYKLNWYHGEEPELFDLEKDPGEFRNVASDPEYAEVFERLKSELMARWDPEEIGERVLRSQERRRFLQPYLFRYLEDGD